MEETKGTIAIASDHAGFETKKHLIEALKGQGYEVIDHGAYVMNAEDDYPDFVASVARDVSRNPENLRGVILGGSGTGEAIMANRFPNVRCVAYYGGNVDIVALSREHNDSNTISLGARFMIPREAEMIVTKWLNTDFSNNERHERRLKRIEEINEEYN
jgi:ribose 5-phosphate isomerase B